MHKKNLRIYLSLVSAFGVFFSVPSWCMDSQKEDYPLTTMTKRAPGNSPHRVVFDVEQTLCILAAMPQQNRIIIRRKYPEAHLIDFDTTSYFFYPSFGEVFLTLLGWGWHVDFFPSKERNEAVIPTYLKSAFEPYSQDVKTDYEALTQKGELRIFAHQHLSSAENRKKVMYEIGGKYQKDLTIVGPIQDTILVDADPSYVMGGEQYPYIGLPWTPSHLFSHHLFFSPEKDFTDTEVNQLNFDDPLDHAPYVLGILAECKGLLQRKIAVSLRDALDRALRKPVGGKFGEEAPWFLWPDQDNPKKVLWIEMGNALIDAMRLRATPRKSEEH